MPGSAGRLLKAVLTPTLVLLTWQQVSNFMPGLDGCLLTTLSTVQLHLHLHIWPFKASEPPFVWVLYTQTCYNFLRMSAIFLSWQICTYSTFSFFWHLASKLSKLPFMNIVFHFKLLQPSRTWYVATLLFSNIMLTCLIRLWGIFHFSGWSLMLKV